MINRTTHILLTCYLSLGLKNSPLENPKQTETNQTNPTSKKKKKKKVTPKQQLPQQHHNYVKNR